MAIVRPFQSIRPNPELARQIAALPYDVYNSAEAREIVNANSFSFLGIDRAEVHFPKEHDMYAMDVYQKAAEELKRMISEGAFIKDEAPCYYLYALTMQGRTQVGFVGCFSIDDYINNVVCKHENTRAEKELDRINHVYVTKAQTGPIFLAYRKNETLESISKRIQEEEPVYDFESEQGVRNRVWVCRDKKTIQEITYAFSGVEKLYIADGHHRCASAVKVGLKMRKENPSYTGEEEFNFVLSVMFSEDELRIMDYNRVVKDLNGLTTEAFLKEVEALFDVKKIEQAPILQKKGTFGMYLEKQWYLLEAPQSMYNQDTVHDLDVSVLQDHILEPILGIHDPKTDKRIDFVGGIRGSAELEKRVNEDCAVAFCMYPTSMQELFAVADAGKLMPPKSTWFEPKLMSGLFIHEI